MDQDDRKGRLRHLGAIPNYFSNISRQAERSLMAGTIIGIVVFALVSSIFIILGIVQYRSKIPVSINTGEKPPREDELTDMTEWNHKHGRNFVIYGCMLFVTGTVFIYFLGRLESVTLELILFFVVIFAEVAWLEVQHSSMKKKMIKH